ncbi:MAG: Lytic transglycosylase, catalytic [Proteobacteria bacterium]|nr:Lytic transglycosylase, catalytic [Pseudomonadota bacterium]
MTNTLILNHPLARTTEAALRTLQNILMLVGAFFVLATAYVYIGKPDLTQLIGTVVPGLAHASEAEEITAEEPETTPGKMDTRLQAALEYSARRYRVSPQALTPIFKAAQENAQEHGLDPLLIISVIAVESSFNPLSESNMGAQGLMQVIPRYHKEKLPTDAGEAPLFDPVINVAVGSKVLKEYVRRHGSVTAGLLQFNGSLNDPSQSYAKKVLAVKERMESATRRGNTTA